MEMQVFSTRNMGSAVALSSILTAAASSEIDDIDCSLTLGISNEGSMSRSMIPVTLNLFDYQTFVDKNEDCAIPSATHGRICWGGGAICTALPSWSDMKPHLQKLNIEEPSLELKLSTNEDRKEDSSPSSEARFEGLESRLMKGRNGGSPTPGKSRVSESNGAKSCTRDGDNGELQRICCDCGTMKTPLWRNGPRGPKSLCNACGIRFKKSGRSRVVGGNIHGAKRKVESSSYEALQCFRRYGLPNKEEIRCETTFKLPLPPLARACSSISLSVNATNTRYLCPTMYATASSMAGEPDISSRRSQWNDHDQKEGALSLMHMSRHLTSRRPPFVT